jgi:hypothetical protein
LGVAVTYVPLRYTLYPATCLLFEACQASETLDAVAALTRRLLGGLSALRASPEASARGALSKSTAAAAKNALRDGLGIGSPCLSGGLTTADAWSRKWLDQAHHRNEHGFFHPSFLLIGEQVRADSARFREIRATGYPVGAKVRRPPHLVTDT